MKYLLVKFSNFPTLKKPTIWWQVKTARLSHLIKRNDTVYRFFFDIDVNGACGISQISDTLVEACITYMANNINKITAVWTIIYQ
jgi:hypothetical protein